MPEATHTLVVRHLPNTDPLQFTVSRLKDGRAAPAVSVAPPNSVRVEGRPNDDLTTQLRWYLEEFLKYPFHPDDKYAQRVCAALQTWGCRTFDTLFGSGQARDFYHDATRNGLNKLTLWVISDSPFILGWPWEALEDSAIGRLAHQCAIERRTEAQADPPPAPQLPTERLNVLLVISRPLQGDVKYRSISRSLVELAAKSNFPITVDVLRPPTFDQLREHLKARKNHYHILHFDGHGAYRTDSPIPGSGNIMLRAADGRLLFETAQGEKDPIEAEKLSELLQEFAVPTVVLNACQSAMIDDRAIDPFASVAAALLKAGTRSVVAMAYALYVSGAQQFLPAFYRTLFTSGNVGGAVRAGRQQMLAKKDRVCSRGVYPLDDWLVPVVYQQDPIDLSFVAASSVKASSPTASQLPEDARDTLNPYGFIGRDSALLALERAMHRKPAGIRITGLGGVGKTTLAKGFLHWLEQTGGLGAGAMWFDFRHIRSAEAILNRLGEAISGQAEFTTLPLPQKLQFLQQAGQKQRLWIVWDNFESACGIAGTLSGNLAKSDQSLLKEYLTGLRGGQTKVLITSRASEDWLGVANVGQPISLGGLDGEERWAFANAVLDDLGLTQNPQKPNPDIQALVELLRGHPLAMRSILPKLAQQSASQLGTAIQKNLHSLISAGTDNETAALLATLQFTTRALPAAWNMVLLLLSLHAEYADADDLEAMAQQVEGGPTRTVIDECLLALGHAGLVRDRGQAIYELHPLLTSHLQAEQAAVANDLRATSPRAFVEVMGRLADTLAPKPLHEQRGYFFLHEANFHAARSFAETLAMNDAYAALTQSLAVYRQNTRNFAEATTLFEQLQTHGCRVGNQNLQASACHQLGIVAQERRDWASAEQWYRKSLEIKERQGNEHGAATTYHQLGRVAQERRDWATAWKYALQALTGFLKYNEPHNAQIAGAQMVQIYCAAPNELREALKQRAKEVGLTDEILHQIETAAQTSPEN